MALSDAPPAPASHSEPPLIERARRVGWGLLALSVLAMVLAKQGPDEWHRWAIGFAIGCGMIGMLAIVNVALVRGLYHQIGEAAVRMRTAEASPADALEEVAQGDVLADRAAADSE